MERCQTLHPHPRGNRPHGNTPCWKISKHQPRISATKSRPIISLLFLAKLDAVSLRLYTLLSPLSLKLLWSTGRLAQTIRPFQINPRYMKIKYIVSIKHYQFNCNSTKSRPKKMLFMSRLSFSLINHPLWNFIDCRPYLSFRYLCPVE